MKLDEIKAFLETTPFTPFEINIIGGKQFLVMHIDFLVCLPGNRIMLFDSNDREKFHFVNIDYISSLSFLTRQDLSLQQR